MLVLWMDKNDMNNMGILSCNNEYKNNKLYDIIESDNCSSLSKLRLIECNSNYNNINNMFNTDNQFKVTLSSEIFNSIVKDLSAIGTVLLISLKVKKYNDGKKNKIYSIKFQSSGMYGSKTKILK
jgi:hypothetical protein